MLSLRRSTPPLNGYGQSITSLRAKTRLMGPSTPTSVGPRGPTFPRLRASRSARGGGVLSRPGKAVRRCPGGRHLRLHCRGTSLPCLRRWSLRPSRKPLQLPRRLRKPLRTVNRSFAGNGARVDSWVRSYTLWCFLMPAVTFLSISCGGEGDDDGAPATCPAVCARQNELCMRSDDCDMLCGRSHQSEQPKRLRGRVSGRLDCLSSKDVCGTSTLACPAESYDDCLDAFCDGNPSDEFCAP